MFRQAAVVAWKECLEGIRDRRALGAALAYAVLGPLLVGVLVGSLSRQETESGFTVGLQREGRAPALARALAEEGIRVDPVTDAAAAVRDSTLDVALEVPESYAEDLEAVRPARVLLYADSTRSASQHHAARVKTLVARLASRIASLRLITRGVAPDVASPLVVEERDIATREAKAAPFFAALPLFLMLAPFVCGLSAAIDATAGERERGSLEPLLLSPVARPAIALGKWAAVTAQSAVGVVATTAVAFLVFRSPLLGNAPFGLEAETAAKFLVLLLPLSAFAAAAMMLMALSSKSFKEAHAKGSTLLLAPMIPGFLFAFGTVAPQSWMRALPVFGHQLLCADAIRGDSVLPGTVLQLGAVTLLAAAILVHALARRLDRDGAALVG